MREIGRSLRAAGVYGHRRGQDEIALGATAYDSVARWLVGQPMTHDMVPIVLDDTLQPDAILIRKKPQHKE